MPYMAIDAAADLIGVCTLTIRKWIKAGRFPGAVKRQGAIGDSPSRVRWFIPVDEVREAMDAHTRKMPKIKRLRVTLTRFLIEGGSDNQADDLAEDMTARVGYDLTRVSTQVQAAARLHAALRRQADGIAQAESEIESLGGCNETT